MSRFLIATLLVATPAFADPDLAPVTPDPPAPDAAPVPQPAIVAVPVAPPDLSDQAIGASLGLAIGGRVTPGGLRIDGHYLYQLSDRDWFDGTAGFTFGGGAAACFRDRSDTYICDHGLTQGDGVSLSANVRHFVGQQGTSLSGGIWPFLIGGIGIGLVHFSNDGVTGLAIPLHAGAGLRMSATSSIAITIQGELEVGFGAFGHSLGLQPQLGAAITAGVEFRL